ncbi:hypothetical protein G2W53_026597 [Senna tora]|uniref:Uncharacterized protein n=1 Tax=Senna tora TaxID=362788 RepID=A0A834TFD4_9FABA|nr:hypothetical protein G2W53_026597 [Senna tora]
MLWLPCLGVSNCFTVVSNDWLLHPAVAKLLAFIGDWYSRQAGVPNTDINRAQEVSVPHQSQRHDALFLGFKILGISMPCQSLGLDAWFLKTSGISMPCQSLGISMPCQSPGLGAWFVGFKISGISMPCQSPGLDAWFLGFKFSGISMPCNSPSLDAWDLDALPIPKSRCLGSRCPANPQVSMPGSLDLKFQGGLDALPFPGLDALFLGYKISRVSMPCQSPGLDAWSLDAMPIPSEGIGNSMEEQIPDTTEKVSINIALIDSVDNLIENGGLP